MDAGRPAILTGWLWLPYEAVGGVLALAELRRRLTFRPRFRAPDEGDVLLYLDKPEQRYIGVPRQFGLFKYPHWPRLDRRVTGCRITVPRLPDPRHPRVRDPVQQANFMADLEAGFRAHQDFIAQAPTGTGKTVCALRAAAVLGWRTIIFVHLERLMDQWIEEIQDKLGVPRTRIGVIQQDRCEFRDRDFAVAMLHSVARRSYEPDLYRSFGTAIFDEVHKIGSEFFAPVAPMFPTLYRLGISATPRRKDGGERVFFWNLGNIRVRSRAVALPMTCYVLPYTTTRKLKGRRHGARVKCLGLDPDRNEWMAGIILRMYQAGRQALLVAENVGHLQHMMNLLALRGVPRAAMGQYTGEHHRRVEEIDPNTGEKIRKISKRKIDPKELKRVKDEAQLVFATYGMITEGIDVPRLDAGMDLTPRGDAEQVIGRIRRPLPGKRHSLWVTVLDTECSMSRRYFEQRCKDYHATGAEVVFHGTQTQGTNRGRNGRTQETVLG